MPEEITMPRLSDTMEEGTVARWHKQEGDPVEPGDLLAEIETDKAIMEFEAPDGGVLLKIAVEEGKPVPVGATIAWVGEKGEAVPDTAAAAPSPAPAAPSPAPPTAPAAVAAPPAPAPPSVPGGRVKASPLARRIAADRGVDLATVRGSGPGGRVIRRDVESAPTGQTAAPPSRPAAAPTPAPQTPAVVAGEVSEIMLSRMRTTIAKRLLESKTTIPHFYAEMEIDVGPLLALREQLNASLTDLKLSVNDFIVRAVALALRRVPGVNASFAGDRIRVFGDIHVGVAVAIDDGLIVPILRNTDTKGLRTISTEVRDLAERARERKLAPEEFTGGTFTITNLGMFGVRRFNAIINPPEAAILAIGAAISTPVVVEDRIEIGQRMSVVLSADHRVVDGALGAQFLATIRDMIENPAGLVV